MLWLTDTDRALKAVPIARLAAYYHAHTITRLRVPDGDDGAGTGLGVYGGRGSDYVCGPHLWREQAGCGRGGWIPERCLVAFRFGVAYWIYMDLLR